MIIDQILDSASKRFTGKKALVFHEKEVSFEELKINVIKLAEALKTRFGIQKGDKVALYLPNNLEYVYGYLACFHLGAVVVPLDYMLKNDELISCLSHSETKLLMAQPKEDVSFDIIKHNVPTLRNILFCPSEDYERSTTLAPAKATKTVTNDNDPALIMYTSGTTGRPKGILLNYKHLEGSPKAMEYFVDLTDKDVKLAAIPFSHIGGFIYIQNCIQFGITLVIMDRFNPFEFLEHIQRYKVTCFHIVPPMYTAMLTVKNIETYDLSSLRWVVVFGAPSSPEILKRFHQYCPNAKLLNGWGMTETCPPNTVTPLNSTKIESIGKPSNVCEIKIVDDKDIQLPVGQIGEIVIRGPYIMAGYYKDPQTTAETIRHGWLHTGDLGRFDDEGFLYIMGRIKEMIKVAGQIVFAPEVEVALSKHEGVLEAAVIGIADKLRGEVVKAFVVLKSPGSLSIDDLRQFAKEHLAGFKVPHSIELRNELPKNRTGKIDKELLKQECSV